MGKELSNTEAILKNWLGQGVEEDPPKSRIEKLLVQIRDEGGGGGGGTTDYTSLTNKPKINNVELLGNKSLADIGVTNAITSATYTKSEIDTALAGKSAVTVDANGNLFIDGNQIWAVLTSAEYAALAEKTLPFYFIKE